MKHVNTPSVTWKQMVELFQKRRYRSTQAGTYIPCSWYSLMISAAVGEGRNRTQGFVETPSYNTCQRNPSVKHFHLSISIYMIHSLQLLLKNISNLEEGVEMQGGEPRKWLFPGPLSEAKDCSYPQTSRAIPQGGSDAAGWEEAKWALTALTSWWPGQAGQPRDAKFSSHHKLPATTGYASRKGNKGDPSPASSFCNEL